MNDKIIEKINEASNANLEAYVYYRSMKNWTDYEGWDGFSHLLNKQSTYNLRDFEKISDFIKLLGYKPSIDKIDKQKEDFKDLDEILELYYNKEEELIKIYYDIVKISRKEKSYQVEIFFENILAHQKKILSNIEPLLIRIKRINGNIGGLYIFNNELKTI